MMVRRGEIDWVEFDPVKRSEQVGRPRFAANEIGIVRLEIDA
jgi:mRNA-degrading endonuclease toxin of MazEF toxin-antitoxin module